MKPSLSSLLSAALLLLSVCLAPAQYVRISQQLQATTAGTNDDLVINVWTGSNYLTRRITVQDFTLSLTNITQAITTNLVKGIVDTNYVRGIVDTNYVRSVTDSNYLVGIIGTNYVRSIVDTNYLRSVTDSNYLVGIIGTNYVRGLVDTNYLRSVTDSNYLAGIIGTNYVRSLVDSNYVINLVTNGTFATPESAYPSTDSQVFALEHGLGARPAFVRVVVRCVVDDAATSGYVVGDEAEAANLVDADGQPRLAFGANATHFWCTAKGDANYVVLSHKTTHAAVNSAKTKWRVVGYARR